MSESHECRKCGSRSSVFWWSFEMSDLNRIFLCDNCAFDLIKWLDTPPKEERK